MFKTITRLFSSTQRTKEIDEDQHMELLDKDLALEMDILNGLSGKARKQAIFNHQKDFYTQDRNESDDEFTQKIGSAREKCARKRSMSNPNHRKLMSMKEIEEEAKQINKRGFCFFR